MAFSNGCSIVQCLRKHQENTFVNQANRSIRQQLFEEEKTYKDWAFSQQFIIHPSKAFATIYKRLHLLHPGMRQRGLIYNWLGDMFRCLKRKS